VAVARAQPVCVLVAAVGLWASLPMAWAQDGAPKHDQAIATAPPLDAVVADLASSAVQARIKASEQLSEGAFTLRDLEGALRGGSLTPEQRQRLMGAARSRFFSGPRAAMGVWFNVTVPDVRGAVVDRLRGEFPAAAILKPDDRILHADGVVIDRRETLQKIIVSHDPGDEVPLVVEREGATIELRVPLGNFEQLRQERYKHIWDLAWDYRSRAYAWSPGSDQKPIESGLLESAWRPMEELDEDAEMLGQLPWIRARLRDPAGERLGVAAGGESRLGLGLSGETKVASLRGPQVGGLDPLQLQIQIDQQQRANLALQLRQAQARLADRTLDPGQRRVVEAEVASLKQGIDQIDAQIQMLQRRAVQVPRDIRPRPERRARP
jgi:hypothetical protein